MAVEVPGREHTGAILPCSRLREAAARWLDISSDGELGVESSTLAILFSWLQ